MDPPEPNEKPSSKHCVLRNLLMHCYELKFLVLLRCVWEGVCVWGGVGGLSGCVCVCTYWGSEAIETVFWISVNASVDFT